MSLEDWLRNNWLHVHSTSPEEIQSLLHSAEEDLRSALIEGIAAGWKLNMAYTAALRCARAALYAEGYRPGRDREHERTIDSLELTVSSIGVDMIRLLHALRKMRHTATYDSMELISEVQADGAIKAALELQEQVTAWIHEKHPQLMI